MPGLRSALLAASAFATSAKHHGLTMAQWAASNTRVGGCPCSNGAQGVYAADNACYDEAMKMCAPPAGPEYHPPAVDVQSLVAGLARVSALVQNSETSLDFEKGAVVGFIENRLNPGQCLDVKDGTDFLQMHSCEFDWDNKTTDQIWKFRPDGFIENVKYPGTCIDVIGNPATDLSRAQLHFCEFGWKLNDQQWVMTDNGFLKNRLTPSKCLDVRGQAQKQEDSDIIMYECNELYSSHPELKTDQTWKLFSVVESGTSAAPVVAPGASTSPSAGPAGRSVAGPTDESATTTLQNVFPAPVTGPTGSSPAAPNVGPADASTSAAPVSDSSDASGPAGQGEGSADTSNPPASGPMDVSDTTTPAGAVAGSDAAVPSAPATDASNPAAGSVIPAAGSVPSPAGSEPAAGSTAPPAPAAGSGAPATVSAAPAEGPVVPAAGSTDSLGGSPVESGPAEGTTPTTPAGNSVPAPAPGSDASSETNPSQNHGEDPSQPAEGNSVPAPAPGSDASSETNPSQNHGEDPSQPAEGGNSAPAPAPGSAPASDPDTGSETIHGQEATTQPPTDREISDSDNHVLGTHVGQSPTSCVCADASNGTLDASLLCWNNGEICSAKTSAVQEGSSSLWPYAAIVFIMLGFLVIGGVVYSLNKSGAKKTRDLDLSPGARTSSDVELISDEEAPPNPSVAPASVRELAPSIIERYNYGESYQYQPYQYPTSAPYQLTPYRVIDANSVRLY